MRSLFIKIFLWFWVAMALVSTASLISALATESYPLFAIPWIRGILRQPHQGRLKMEPGSNAGHALGFAGNTLRLSGRTAIDIYERDGKEALFDFVNRVEDSVHIQMFLFKGDGSQLTDRFVPEEVSQLAATAEPNRLDYKRSGESMVTALRLTGSKSEDYILVAKVPVRHFITRDYPVVLVHLLVILITAGGVCYWLARYIANPVSRLGAAARRLADGELETRVGPMLGKRRDEIGELAKDFDLMAERIDSLMTAQKRLIRDISHEFRSPLTRLGLALEIAKLRRGSEANTALERIGLEAERLNALITRLLTLARMESGVEEIEKQPVDMAELLEEVVADANFEARGHKCSVRVLSSEICFVEGARELLRSAVENVLRNAIRYTAEGTEIEVKLLYTKDAGPPHAIIEVRDHGPGVPEEALSDLFYPFYRVGFARDRQRGGTGLGLAITERAVRLHGGEVSASNAPGGGLSVTVVLPAINIEEVNK